MTEAKPITLAVRWAYERWASGLDTAGSSASLHFSGWASALAHEPDNLPLLRQALRATLAYLHPDDRGEWQTLLDHLNTMAPEAER